MSRKPLPNPKSDLPATPQKNTSDFVNILKEPLKNVTSNPLITNWETFSKILNTKKSLILTQNSVNKTAKKTTKDLASLYRLRINEFAKKRDPKAVQETLDDYNLWSTAIKEIYGRCFDIFIVFQKDIAEMKKVLAKITVQAGSLVVPFPMQAFYKRKAAQNGSLHYLKLYYGPGPFTPSNQGGR